MSRSCSGPRASFHMEIIQERLEREYDLDIIVTAPSVEYEVVMHSRGSDPHRLARRPARGRRYRRDPRALDEGGDLHPHRVLRDGDGPGHQAAGHLHQSRNIPPPTGCMLDFEIPLSEIIVDFFDQLKSRTRGYASMDYQFLEYRPDDLVKLEILVNDEPVDALATIVHRDEAYHKGQALVSKLKDSDPAPVVRGAHPGFCRGADHLTGHGQSDAQGRAGEMLRRRYLAQEEAAGKAEAWQETHEDGGPGGNPAGSLPGRPASWERNEISYRNQSQTKRDWQRIIPGLVVSAVVAGRHFHAGQTGATLIQAIRAGRLPAGDLGGLFTFVWLVAAHVPVAHPAARKSHLPAGVFHPRRRLLAEQLPAVPPGRGGAGVPAQPQSAAGALAGVLDDRDRARPGYGDGCRLVSDHAVICCGQRSSSARLAILVGAVAGSGIWLSCTSWRAIKKWAHGPVQPAERPLATAPEAGRENLTPLSGWPDGADRWQALLENLCLWELVNWGAGWSQYITWCCWLSSRRQSRYGLLFAWVPAALGIAVPSSPGQ